MLGNEGSGLRPDLLGASDAVVSIPLNLGVDSLNVAVAAAPLLLERRRQQMGAGAPGQTPGPRGGENAPSS